MWGVSGKVRNQEAWYETEMARVQSSDTEAKLQGSCSNHQIFKGYADTLSSGFTFDSADQASNFNGEWIYGNVTAKPVNKCEASFSSRRIGCPVGAVRQFGNAHN